MSALVTIRQTTDGFDVDQLMSAGYDESSIDIDDIPRFEFVVPNLTGLEAYRHFVGKEVLIKRLGAVAMPGIVEDVIPTQGGGRLTQHTVKGLHTGYALLQAKKLTNYDFDEDGLPATTRDGVTINPHNRIIFRAPNGTLGVDGLPPAVDGVSFDLQAKAIIGTRMIHQIDFVDNKYLIPSQVYATANAIQVYRDGPQSQTRPALQRVRNGANFKSGVEIHSVPLYGNDPNVNVGGIISSVDVTFIGKRDSGSNNITVSVCRNASAVPASRTYTSVALTYTANSPIIGLDKWVGTVTFSGSETVKNVLGFKVNIAGGTGTTDTTWAYYAKLVATTATDSGITEGTIDAYANPFTMGGAENWIEADFQGDNALDALARLQGLTASNPAVNPNPHYDMWVDANLAFNFKERRGTTLTKEYSFAEKNLKVIEHQFLGTDVRYQTIAYGPGSGDAQTRIVSKQAFTSGGLYDADRDWTVNPSTALYGRRAKVGDFVDANEPSVLNLLRKAYADHKLHRDPIEAIRAEILPEVLPFFTVGDSLPIKNLPTRTNATPRVIKLRRNFHGHDREKLDCTFGQTILDVTDRMRNSQDQTIATTIRSIPNDAQLGISGNGLYFDKDHYGVYPLPIQDGAAVKGVKLRVGILPWQATSKAAGAVGGTTVPSSSGTTNTFDANKYFGALYSLTHFHSGTGSGNNAQVVADTNSPLFQFSVGAGTGGGSLWVLIGYFRNMDYNSKTTTLEFRKGSTSGTVLGTVTISSLASGSYVNYRFVISDGAGSSQITTNDVIYIVKASGTVHYTDEFGIDLSIAAPHTHTTDISGHTHALTFGIFQFGGDADTTGALAPLYGKDISFAIDPADANNDGIPSGAEFTAAQFPALIGHSQTVPGTYEFDITGFLTTEANGIIKSGEHRVLFKGLAGTSNALGLSVLSVTPIFDYKRS